jgi:hypothetical protein
MRGGATLWRLRANAPRNEEDRSPPGGKVDGPITNATRVTEARERMRFYGRPTPCGECAQPLRRMRQANAPSECAQERMRSGGGARRQACSTPDATG